MASDGEISLKEAINIGFQRAKEWYENATLTSVNRSGRITWIDLKRRTIEMEVDTISHLINLDEIVDVLYWNRVEVLNMDNNQKEEVKQLIEAMMKKMTREKVMDTLSQLLHLPIENFDELAEYCRMLDERETTNR